MTPNRREKNFARCIQTALSSVHVHDKSGNHGQGPVAKVAHLTPTSEVSETTGRIADAELRARLLELIEDCGVGNRTAFRRLYDLTSHRVFGIVLGRTDSKGC